MKIRIDFITNSSSSSFIAIYCGKKTCIQDIKDKILSYNYDKYPAGIEGNCRFGWNQDVYSDFDSKLNYLVLQILITKKYFDTHDIDKQHMDIRIKYLKELKNDVELLESNLQDIFKKEFSIPCDFSILKEKMNFNGYGTKAYIDHQSCFYEDFNLKNVFCTKENIYDFLFKPQSVIGMGNDNDDSEFNDNNLPYQCNKDFSLYY